jgi:hypothetical protein
MTGNEAVLNVASALDDCGVPYMLVGSHTHDNAPNGKRAVVGIESDLPVCSRRGRSVVAR